MGLTRSAAFRVVYTLAQMRFLEEGAAKTYTLGPRVLRLGFAYLAAQDLVRAARGELERLAAETGVSAHLAVREGREVLYLDCAQPPRSAYVSSVTVGARRQAHASPLGWLTLGDLRGDEIAALYAGAEMERATEHTPGTPGALAARVAEAAAAGHVVSRGFLSPGGASVAAALSGPEGRIVAAIDVSGPDSAFSGGLEERYLPAVTAAAVRISERLGG